MPITATYQRTFQASGLSFNNTQALSAEVAPPFSVTLPAAKTGTLTTRTDANTGELTMASGHGITTGARLDLYWSGGSRRGITVGTVATNSVPFDLGDGDDLPVATTAITAMVPAENTLAVPGDDLVGLAVSCPVGGTVVFAAADDSEIYASVRTTASPSEVISVADGTNPFEGETVAKVFLSHGSSAAASTLTGVVMYDD